MAPVSGRLIRITKQRIHVVERCLELASAEPLTIMHFLPIDENSTDPTPGCSTS